MLEFGGETFRAAFREDEGSSRRQAAVKELMDYLAAADFVIILVSLKELLRDDVAVADAEFERSTEALWVTRGLIEFIRERLPGAGVVIGLTQADRYRDALAAAGGPAAVFAARWPRIRAVAPDFPVVEIASVSATDADGRPAEGFRTDGILPAMREFARQTCGDADELVKELSALREDLDAYADGREAVHAPISGDSAYSSRVRKFSRLLAAVVRATAITGDDRSRGIGALEAALARHEAEAKKRRAKKSSGGRRRKSRRRSRPVVRRVFLLALLLALTVAYDNEYLPHGCISAYCMRVSCSSSALWSNTCPVRNTCVMSLRDTGLASPKMHDTVATTITSRRSISENDADSLILSISSFTSASFSMYRSLPGTRLPSPFSTSNRQKA